MSLDMDWNPLGGLAMETFPVVRVTISSLINCLLAGGNNGQQPLFPLNDGPVGVAGGSGMTLATYNTERGSLDTADDRDNMTGWASFGPSEVPVSRGLRGADRTSQTFKRSRLG